MAIFDNVTYTFYSSTLGRTIVPDAATFDSLKLENIQQMKRWLPYVTELEENGVDKAVCMMIEVQYSDNELLNGNSDNAIASENLGGHSVSYGSNARTKLEDANLKSTQDKKIDVVKWFCDFDLVVR